MTGMLSCQQTQNVIDGKKRIILNPGEGQKKDFETVTFAEGDVYGIDILVSSGEDGKVKSNFFCVHPWDFQRWIVCDDVGETGGIANDDLPARPYGFVPAQDENGTCCIHGSTEKSWTVPVQRACARG